MVNSRLPLVLLLLVPSAGQAQTDSVTAARRADLQLFRTEFLARDNAYTPATRAEAEARLGRLEADAGQVTAVWFDLELARIVALADNGHTAMFAGPRARKYNRVPIRLVPFGTDWYVLRAAPSLANLLGARLTAVNGHPIAEVVDSGRNLAGGTDGWRDRSLSYFLESPEQLAGLGLASAAASASYRFTLPDGGVAERDLTGDPPADDRDNSAAGRYLYPAPVAGAAASWPSLLPVDRTPWVFREGGDPFRWRPAPELDAIVVQLRANSNAQGRNIREFASAMMDTLRIRKPTHVIIDMRGNGGGDLNTTRGFFQSLPMLVPGRIFVLTSPWTFSAGISSVGYLKQAAPDRVTIVGEAVGDRLEFWAEGGIVRLPGTGNVVLPATERHDYRNGCKAFKDCHRSVVRNPIAVPSLAPDIEAPLTIEAYRAGRDPGMEAIAKELGAVSREP